MREPYKSIFGTNATDRSVMTEDELELMDGLCEEADSHRELTMERRSVALIARLARELGQARKVVAEPASLGAEAPKKFPLLFSDDWLRSTVPSDPEGEPMAGGTTSRFYIDHGAIHDRKTGQHVGMDAEPESVERLLALLQELELQHQPIKAGDSGAEE